MPLLIEKDIGCPYCGETITMLVDDSLSEQTYVEDCQVCCRPIVVDVGEDPGGGLVVRVNVENE